MPGPKNTGPGQLIRNPFDRRLVLVLLLDLVDDADLGCACVFERVRRDWRYPKGGAWCERRGPSAVEGNGTALVAANKVADAEDIEGGGPAMSVQGSSLAGLDHGVQDANGLVFEEELVVLGSGGECVEF